MHVHAHHQHAHTCSVFRWLATARRRFANMSSAGRLNGELWREEHDRDVGGADTGRTLEAKTGLAHPGEPSLALSPGEPCTYVETRSACSDVKHKKQSCRSSRTSVTPTRVCLCGFSMMFPPLYKGKGDSFVSLFFSVSTFLSSWFCLCRVFMYEEALCLGPLAAGCTSLLHLNPTGGAPHTHLTSAARFRSFFLPLNSGSEYFQLKHQFG